jgi:thiamine kinase
LNASSKLTPEALIARYFPAAQAAGTVSTVQGLSGGSIRIACGDRIYAARRSLPQAPPGVSLARQYRALKQRLPGTGPTPRLLAGGWLVTDWLHGRPCAEAVNINDLAALLRHLHAQRRFGWRISLPSLLTFYWQAAAPERRSRFWLSMLKRLHQQGEPAALKLAPLHMDVHGDNLIQTPDGLRLIDWEYAGDGDIALELAATGMGEALTQAYAERTRYSAAALARQVRRWQPWVQALMASWYEWRWQQTRQRQFIQLADDAWRRLRFMEYER